MASSTDTVVAIKAMEGIELETAKGRITVCAEDHQVIQDVNFLQLGPSGAPPGCQAGWSKRRKRSPALIQLLYGMFSVVRHVIHRMKSLSPMEFGERGVIVNTAPSPATRGRPDRRSMLHPRPPSSA